MKMRELNRTVIKFREGIGLSAKQDGVYFGGALIIPNVLWSSTSIFTNEVTLADGVSFNSQDFIDGKIAIVDGREGHSSALHLINPALIESIAVKKITIFVE